MAKKNVMIKCSGDLIFNEIFFKFAKKTSENSYLVVICGAGKQTNEAFRKKGFKIKFGPAGRETDSKGKKLSRNILEKNRKKLQDIFTKRKINAKAITPIINTGKVFCLVNGDDFIIAAYNGFDEIYVITTQERVKEKKKRFAIYPKIKIIGIKEA